MVVIIVGAGEVGFHLAKTLSSDSHDVVVIDTDPEKCARVQENFDVLVKTGSGASARVLLDAGIKKAEMLIAVSAIDEVNIIACMMANQFGVKRKIARIRNPEYALDDAILKPQQLGIDVMINPEQTTAEEIIHLIELSAASDVIEFINGRIQLVGIRLEATSDIINKTLQEVSQSNPHLIFRTVAIYRNEQTIIPMGNEYFRKGDQIFVTALTESVQGVLKLHGKNDNPVRKLMILGGTLVGRRVAKMLERQREIDVRLIESNKEKSVIAADELERTLVIRGDGSDVDLLAREGILDMDAFVAATDDEESNIITCLLAKHLGVKRTIAIVSKSDYVPLLPSIGLEAVVDKRKITANAIARFIRHGEIVSVATLQGIGAEALELVVQPNAKIAGRYLKKVRLPAGVILGGAIRDNDVFIPVGDTIIQPYDQVVLIGLPKALNKVEKMFG